MFHNFSRGYRLELSRYEKNAFCTVIVLSTNRISLNGLTDKGTNLAEPSFKKSFETACFAKEKCFHLTSLFDLDKEIRTVFPAVNSKKTTVKTIKP